jgi:hypothetical protein
MCLAIPDCCRSVDTVLASNPAALQECWSLRESQRGSNPCLHLESVLGPTFATCGDGRIWLLTCGFDAPAVPVVS